MITATSALFNPLATTLKEPKNTSKIEPSHSASITPLTNPAPHKIEWQNNSIADNKQIEANLSRLASESPAAHKTADALLATMAKLFILVEKNELKATTTMLANYAPDTPKFSVVGQLGAGGFSRVMDEARHGDVRARNGQEPLTLREKVTVFFKLTYSTYFRETMEQIYNSPELKKLAADIVDISYLESKQFAPARGSSKERPLADELELYTFRNESKNDASENVHLYEQLKEVAGQITSSNAAKAGSSLTKVQNDREKPQHADSVWASAADLAADQRLTGRELVFAHYNPRNRADRDESQFGNLGPVKAFAALALEQTVVERGNGFAVWQVKEGTGFLEDAQLQHKPTVAGPSRTTDRFMTAARLLGSGLKSELGLSRPKGAETPEQSNARAETEMKELVRWTATGYLVDDNHHSMIEVNLGAANHGLSAQWGTALYSEPFSAPIKTDHFTVSSEEVMRASEQQSPVKVHYENFRYDLQGGGRAKFTPDGRIT
ncbi:type III effector [Pseudomonas fluorescens]|uniref:Type III effector n=1 Tax=Pseudomonas fluorescens TaxID=294 RepID=A0A5E7KPV2_PSEFL|nr:type III effector [Pseudomonas fluorescens]VVP03952.1 hypothetical protein PS880_02965 [Pseudomonas fluorescens]